MAVTHPFVSAKADGTDTSRVRPSNWNANHSLTGGTDGQTLVRDSGQSDGANLAFRSRVLNVNTTTVGNVGGGTDDLMTYTLPASTLSTNGYALRVRGGGTTAANGNTKTIAFVFGASSVTINPTTTAPNNQNWFFDFTIIRTGAATQVMFGDSTAGAVGEGTYGATPTETLSSAVTIKCTGNSGSSATNDVVQTWLIVEGLNC